jgi:ABC-type polysaccharide transport system permease subunit
MSRLQLTLMAIPFMLLIIAFHYIPLHGWLYAFYDYRPGVPLLKNPFIGFANFGYILDDMRNISRVVGNTLIFYGLNLITSVIPAILAIMLSEVQVGWFKKLVQTTTTLPYFVSWIIIFSFAFNLFSTGGIVNQVLENLNLVGNRSSILMNLNAVYGFQTALGVWKSAGWGSIIYIAAIAGIDSELYDAASVDGAGRFRKIRHITIPGIAPTFVVLMLLSVSNMLSIGLDQYLVFYNGFVGERIEVLDYYVYRIGLVSKDYSYSIAVGMIKTFISLTLLFSVNGLAKKIRGDSII